MWHESFNMTYCIDLYLIWFWIYCVKRVQNTGPNVLSMPKFIHVGFFAANFGDEIIKNVNFQKMVPNGVPGTPFRTPPGTPMGPNVLLVVDNICLHHPHPD